MEGEEGEGEDRDTGRGKDGIDGILITEDDEREIFFFLDSFPYDLLI